MNNIVHESFLPLLMKYTISYCKANLLYILFSKVSSTGNCTDILKSKFLIH